MKQQIEMYFDIGKDDAGCTTLVPVVMVGDKQLRLDKHLGSAQEAKTFLQAFIIGNSLGGPQEFLDLYAERQHAKGLDEDDEAFTDGLEGL